jgi:hypothetical protein
MCCVFTGVLGADIDVRGNRDRSGELEAYRVGSDPAGLQGVGRPGRVERRLLPDHQGRERRGHVSNAKVTPSLCYYHFLGC